MINDLAKKFSDSMSLTQMQIDDYDSRIKELQKLKKALVENVDDQKNKIRIAMADNGITRIESDDFLFRLDPPTKTLKIINESQIPDKFFKIVRQLDKTAVKKAIEVDGFVDGAEIVDGKHRLVIKEK